MTEFTLDDADNKNATNENVSNEINLGNSSQSSFEERQAYAVPSMPRAQENQTEKKLWLNVTDLEDEDIEELLETLSFYTGNTTVWFVKNGKKMLCSQKVTPNKALMAELYSFLPENSIKLI